eukprot:760444-Hanusia_phi.AAC.3
MKGGEGGRMSLSLKDSFPSTMPCRSSQTHSEEREEEKGRGREQGAVRGRGPCKGSGTPRDSERRTWMESKG